MTNGPRIGSNERPDWPLAVVVGGGGLGMVVARRVGLSHRLLVADRDGEMIERQCAALREQGYDATGIAGDVTRPDDVARLASAAKEAGPVRALVNVVGLSVAANDFRLILSVNLIGANRIAAAFREIMIPGAAAVFISSSSAHLGTIPDAVATLLDSPASPAFLDDLEALLGEDATPASAYRYSKAGLNRMCRREAASWGARGLRIVSLSPGLIATPMGIEAYRHSKTKRDMLDAVPLQREGTMMEIAGVADFLISDAASYISGTDILVDGGLIATYGRPRSE